MDNSLNGQALLKVKKEINDKVNKGILYDWNDILQSSIQSGLDQHLTTQLRRWYELIFDQTFLDDLPSGAEEIFFHNCIDSEVRLSSTLISFFHDIQEADFELMLKVLSLKNNIKWSYAIPFCSFYFKREGVSFRISLIHKSVTANTRPKAFFRILNKKTISLASYSHEKSLTSYIKDKKNILIAGSTGSGKTTLANTLLSKIQSKEHILILEDTFELISPNEKSTRLLASDKPNTDLDSLLTYALRMSPDRIILGELRSKEVTTFIQAMNTGHRGMLSTIHANTASDALSRVAILFSMYSGTTLSYELVLKLVCQNIDHVIYIEDKKIKEVIDVYGSEGSQVFYESTVSS
jgi:type IV secretory pathway ATPase VirB11/archaellum biosynthesis ATPase